MGILLLFAWVCLPCWGNQPLGPIAASEHEVLCTGITNPASFQGLYEGYFGQSPIIIALEWVSEEGKATGYSLHKGLRRPFSGTWEKVQDSGKVKFLLHEPGDNPFDGHFELLFDAVTFQAEGSWFPKPGSGLNPAMVTLKKQ